MLLEWIKYECTEIGEARKIERLWQWSVGGVPVPFSLVGDAGVCVCVFTNVFEKDNLTGKP